MANKPKKPYRKPQVERLATTLDDVANGHGTGSDFAKARTARPSR